MTTSFASLVTDVYSLTNRPDLVNETALAVKAATLKAHQSDYYYKDLFESGIIFAVADYQQTFEYKTLVPQWRSAKYMRKCSNDTPPVPGDFLKLLAPDDVLDNYKINREDVYYMSGVEMQIRSSTQQATYLLGCYVHPVVILASYNSWIADEHPFVIIYEAARIIYKTIGFDEQEAAYKKMVDEQIMALKMSQIVADGS